jgi:hypothetical protein
MRTLTASWSMPSARNGSPRSSRRRRRIENSRTAQFRLPDGPANRSSANLEAPQASCNKPELAQLRRENLFEYNMPQHTSDSRIDRPSGPRRLSYYIEWKPRRPHSPDHITIQPNPAQHSPNSMTPRDTTPKLVYIDTCTRTLVIGHQYPPAHYFRTRHCTTTHLR